jgi:hypothetical protein
MPFHLRRVMRLFSVRERSRRCRSRLPLRLVELETRTLLSVQLPGPHAIGVASSGPVAVADLTGNGRLDIVASNLFDNSVSVLLGNGDGTFRPQKDYPTGLFPSSVVVADVNGDGKPDIIVANQNGNSVSVLLGNGDGTFQPKKDYLVGQYPASVVVADVNRDGKPDIIVANLLDSTVSVLLGNGDGSFQAGPTVLLPKGYGPASVAVADLTGAGKQDLVTADSYTNKVSVMRGNGDGSFQRARLYGRCWPGLGRGR